MLCKMVMSCSFTSENEMIAELARLISDFTTKTLCNSGGPLLVELQEQSGLQWGGLLQNLLLLEVALQVVDLPCSNGYHRHH